MEELNANRRQPIDLWLENYACRTCDNEVSVGSGELFMSYKIWCDENGFKYTNLNCQRFGMNLNALFPAKRYKQYFETGSTERVGVYVTKKRLVKLSKLRDYYNGLYPK